MSHVLKPKIFNDENAMENAEAIHGKNDEIRGSMMRAEKLSAATRLFAVALLAAVLIRDLVPASLLSGLISIRDFSSAFGFIKNTISGVTGVLLSEKLYYFCVIAALWYIVDRPSLFLTLFVENFASAYKKGLKLMQKQKYELAAEKFTTALKNFMPPSEQIKIRLALAECYFTQGDYDECLKDCFEILELDGGNEAAKNYIARAFLQQNERGELAVKYYIHMFNREMHDQKMLDILSSHFLALSDLSETAISVYKKIYELSSENTAVREMIFKACVIVNDRSSYALKLYEDIYAGEPGRKDIKLALVSAYYESKDFRRAADTARALFDQNEFSRKLLEIYAESMKKSGHQARLYEDFMEMISRNPQCKVLADYFEVMKPVFLAGRLMNDAAAGPAEGGGQSKKAKINICGNCAHMNPSGISHCEKCRSALGTG
jgi:tetratricopeptide (TPR) repeat protein